MFPSALFNLFSRRRLVYDMDSWMSQQLTDKWRALRPLRPLLVGIERLAVRRATVVLPVCEDLAQVVRGWVDPRSAWSCCRTCRWATPSPGGVEESLRAIAGPDALIALYVGNLERYQGIDLMLDGSHVCRVTHRCRRSSSAAALRTSSTYRAVPPSSGSAIASTSSADGRWRT